MTDDLKALADEIERTLQGVALYASVPMGIWQRHSNACLAAITRLRAAKPAVPASFQERVTPWLYQCFGPVIAGDKVERADRFIEEALELVQSGGHDKARTLALVEYVYGREPGNPAQEVGGVQVTLAAYCLAHGLDMHAAGEQELARISAPEVVEKIRAKQAAKPTGSALLVAMFNAAPEPKGDHIAEAGKMVEPSDEDVERVAEALWEQLQGNERIRHLETWRGHARAAIKAMGR